MGKWFEENKDKIFKKYDKWTLREEIIDFRKQINVMREKASQTSLFDDYVFDWETARDKGFLIRKNINHFFKEILFTAKRKEGKYRPIDFIQNDELVAEALEYCKKYKYFTEHKKDNNGNMVEHKAIEAYMRNDMTVSNFPSKEMVRFFDSYDIKEGMTYYDPSCGWGIRMFVAHIYGLHYHGTDPNSKLQIELNKGKNYLLSEFRNLAHFDINLYEHGSEKFIPELENNVDVVFTSPPYFDLEIYTDEETQSIGGENANYENWINLFVKPTIKNIVKYLKVGGIVAINIKNGKFKLFDDWERIFESYDCLQKMNYFELEQQSSRTFKDSSGNIVQKKNIEQVMVFKKVKNV